MASTAHLGVDVSTPIGDDGMPDLDPAFGLASGGVVLGQAIARRLVTPRRGLLDDPTYGYDTRSALGDHLTAGDLRTIESRVIDQCEADERVDTATCAATFDETTERLTLRVFVRANDGTTVTLTLAVTAVSAEVLAIEAT